MQNNADILRKIANMIRIGTIAEVDHATQTARVSSGDLTTDFLPWCAGRAGKRSTWSPRSIGEQVILVCPQGETTRAFILGALYSKTNPPPDTSENRHVSRYGDGAVISYDEDAHALHATLPRGGTATLSADGGITLNGPVTINGATTINGNASIKGKAEATEDVIGGGVSLKSHVHKGVQSGGAVSGPPA
ncbi:phage baseplate assembly protein V [Lysobacter sp. CA199]|uniref:phage baseplate assembly protein V n=1 Tax=Lysobacter sp. CA199 TaxID=3455608 RepID=UPI003F8D719D